MTEAIKFREKFPRTNATKRNILTFNENLADVTIEVFPSATNMGSGSDPQQHNTHPAAKIPAHVAILTGRNEYFRALFSNGMAETLEPSQTLCTINAADGQNVLVQRSRRNIKIKGYSVEAVKYFIAHLYDDSKACAAQERESLQEWEELLKMADEFESFSLFDTVSYEMMDQLLADPSGMSNDHVITLLNLAYEFSAEISEILRKGCWWYYDQHYLKVLGTKELTQNAKKSLKSDLLADLFLRVLRARVSALTLNCVLVVHAGRLLFVGMPPS
ncbi:hypothetical protein DFS34DRAFT_690555 [Phlyctochytrium arcticum]|nr:hypothetical protein DFS34DRAFT_690555 [Phlyctochytrium arcticum]